MRDLIYVLLYIESIRRREVEGETAAEVVAEAAAEAAAVIV